MKRLTRHLSKFLMLPLAVGAIAFTTSAPASAGDSITLQAVGQAAIYSGDKAAARDKAIADAVRKAVEQAVGVMVSSETVTENFELISDKILSKSKGYVRKYKILSEGEDGGVVQIKIEAEVSTGDLKNDVDGIMAVLEAKEMPRVLLMLTEQNVGAGKKSSWWGGGEGGGGGGGNFSLDLGVVENAFIDTLGPKGFDFVDRQALQGKISVSKGIGGDPTDSQVKEFAVGTGAEVVIYGKSFANDVGTIMGTQMHSVRANISLRALSLGTGSIIATSTQTQMVGHIDPITGGTQALEKVARKAAKDLLGKILIKWEKEVSGPQRVKLIIKGVKKSKLARQIAKFMGNEIRGVQKVRQRSYKKRVAEYEVMIKGNAQQLAEELEEKKFGKYGIEIEEMGTGEIIAIITGK